MKITRVKQYPTIACCGIDCGLCPRYHTDGQSKCPGCGGVNFSEKHPSCSILTCCVNKKQFETCADCSDVPCEKIQHWDRADSFVTHKNALKNLQYIKEHGLPPFIHQQHVRIELLEQILAAYDDGRSKSFFCLAVALLPIEEIANALEMLDHQENTMNDKKFFAKLLRDVFQQKAIAQGIELVYRKTKT